MQDENLTQEESDALILQEMGLADENSISNQEEEQEEETFEESEESEESEEETEEPQEEEEEADTSTKPKGKIPKLLHQRNEERRAKEEALSRVQELENRLQELDAEGNYGNEEYVKTLVDKQIAQREELDEYFEENSEIRPFKKEILQLQRTKGYSLEDATKLYLAENNPMLLLQETDRNKQKAKIFNAPQQVSQKTRQGEYKYTDEEFDKLAREGKITF